MYFIVRSQDQLRDSRLRRYVSAQRKHITIISWERSDSCKDEYTFNLKGNYGSGLKNALSILRFNWHVIVTIFKYREVIKTLHAVDLDVGLVCFFLAKFLKITFIYESFDHYADSRNIRFLRAPVSFIEKSIILCASLAILPDLLRLPQYGIKGLPENVIEIENVPLSFDYDYISEEKTGFVYLGVLESDRKITELAMLLTKFSCYDVFGYGKLEEAVRENPHINFKGDCAPDEVLSKIKKYKFMIACYDTKNKNNRYAAPNKYFEAIFSGTPLITNSGTLLAKKLSSNDAGIVFETYADLEKKITMNDRDYKSMQNNLLHLSKGYQGYWGKKIHEVNSRIF